MTKVVITNDEIELLKKYNFSGREAVFYDYKGNLLKRYKPLPFSKNLSDFVMQEREYKNKLLMEHVELDKYFIRPVALAYDENDNFIGPILPFRKEMTFEKYLSKNKNNIEGIYNYYLEISRVIEELHQQGIILHDFNTRNVFIFDDGIKFCDADSYKYGSHNALMVTSFMITHYKTKNQEIKQNEVLDKEIMLLCMLRDCYKTSVMMDEYDTYIKKLNSLVKNYEISDEVYNELVKLKIPNEDIKYPHEFMEPVKKKTKRLIFKGVKK